MWSTVVVGTHPVQADQAVWVEFKLEDQEPNRLPGYWLENRGVNSFWHVALPPQAVRRPNFRPLVFATALPWDTMA